MIFNTRMSITGARRLGSSIAIVAILAVTGNPAAEAAGLRAGVARVEITNKDAGPVNDPLYAKALVLTDDATTVVIVTIDAVALGEIGPIPNDYLGKVREALTTDPAIKLKINPKHVLINASHCHGIARADSDRLTVQAVREAMNKLEPVHVGAGTGQENRIQENRRLALKHGGEGDVRHAYPVPADEEIAKAGPIDPEIGILRLDRADGRTLAVVYNFACHPIQGVPSGGNTADLVGFASKAIEDNLPEGALALFLQGCGGDINPISYKDPDHPRDAEPLGNLLGLSTLRALKTIRCKADDRFTVRNETIALPRADYTKRIAEREAEQTRLVQSLQGTTLDLKAFVPLAVKYGVSGAFPSAPAARYLHDRKLGRTDFDTLDAKNRDDLARYAANVRVMEALVRNQTNIALLKKNQAKNVASGSKTIDVEVAALRVGDFVLVTFPGELTVRVGLNLKKASPHESTFVAGYTNGYIYYTPTEEQLANTGAAQEDCDRLVGSGWQALFENKALEILKGL